MCLLPSKGRWHRAGAGAIADLSWLELSVIFLLRQLHLDSPYSHHHRMRKEGHTKIIEYSLTPKQQMQDEQMGIQRKNILITANQSKARSALKRPKKNGSKGEDGATARQLRHDSDAESREGYNVDQVDSDADSDDPEAPNGRAATPASSSDDDDQGSEAPEDNTIPMDLDEEEEAELQADLADVSLARPPPSTTTNRAKQTERIMTSEECRLLLRELFKNESEICGLLYSPHGPIPTEQQNDPKAAALPAPHLSAVSSDMFFIDVLAVPPSRFRPAATLGDMMFESPQNELLSNVVSGLGARLLSGVVQRVEMDSDVIYNSFIT